MMSQTTPDRGPRHRRSAAPENGETAGAPPTVPPHKSGLEEAAGNLHETPRPDNQRDLFVLACLEEDVLVEVLPVLTDAQLNRLRRLFCSRLIALRRNRQPAGPVSDRDTVNDRLLTCVIAALEDTTRSRGPFDLLRHGRRSG